MTTNDESFLLTLCRHKTSWEQPPGSVRKGSSTEFATENQSSISLQSHHARTSSRRDSTNPISLTTSNLLKSLRFAQPGSCCELDFGRSFWLPQLVEDPPNKIYTPRRFYADGLAPFRLKTAHPGPGSFFLVAQPKLSSVRDPSLLLNAAIARAFLTRAWAFGPPVQS